MGCRVQVVFEESADLIANKSSGGLICVANWYVESLETEICFVKVNFVKGFIRWSSLGDDLGVTE